MTEAKAKVRASKSAILLRNYEDEPFSEEALWALSPGERLLAQHINALNKELGRLNVLVLSVDQTMRRNLKK